MTYSSATNSEFIDILDRAFNMYRRNWNKIWRAILPILLTFVLLFLITRVLFGNDSEWAYLFQFPPWEIWNSLVYIVVSPLEAVADFTIVSIIFFLIGQALFTRAILQQYNACDVEHGHLRPQLYQQCSVIARLVIAQISWLPFVVGTALLYYVINNFGEHFLYPSRSGSLGKPFMFDISDPFLLDRGFYCVMFFTTVRCWMTPIIIVVEQCSLFAALRQSWFISKGHYWQLFLIGVMTILLTGVIASTPPLLVLWLSPIHLFPLVYPYGLVTKALMSLASLSILPVFVAILTCFYDFCRAEANH